MAFATGIPLKLTFTVARAVPGTLNTGACMYVFTASEETTAMLPDVVSLSAEVAPWVVVTSKLKRPSATFSGGVSVSFTDLLAPALIVKTECDKVAVQPCGATGASVKSAAPQLSS